MHIHLTRNTRADEPYFNITPSFLPAEVDHSPELPLLWAALFDPENIKCRLQRYGKCMGDQGWEPEEGKPRLPTGLIRSSKTKALARLRRRLPLILEKTDPFLHRMVHRFVERLEAFESAGLEVNYRVLTSWGCVGESRSEVVDLLREAWQSAMDVLSADKPMIRDTYTLYGFGEDRTHRLWHLEPSPASGLWRHGRFLESNNLLKDIAAAHDLEALRDMYCPGMDPNMAPYSFWRAEPPVILCAIEGFWEGVDHLLELGADPTIRGLYGQNLLHVAAWGGVAERIRPLIELGLPLEREDDHYLTPFLFACNEGHTEAARVLIELGADVMARNSNGCSGVLLAVANNNLELLKLLVQAGVPADLPNDDKVDPVTLCVLQGFAEGRDFLLQHLVSLDEKSDEEAGHGNGCERD